MRASSTQPYLTQRLDPPVAADDGGEGDAAAAAEAPATEGGAGSGGPKLTREQLSEALLAMVALLPDWSEDVPVAPAVVAGTLGHLLARGCTTFGLAELARALREAGADEAAAAADGDDGAADPPLVDGERAAPMLLSVLAELKVRHHRRCC